MKGTIVGVRNIARTEQEGDLSLSAFFGPTDSLNTPTLHERAARG